MDTMTETSGLGMNTNIESYLRTAGKRAKFLAIMGFIGAVFIFFLGLFFIFVMPTVADRIANINPSMPNPTLMFAKFPVVMGVIYILLSLVLVYGYRFLYRFADKISSALAARSQDMLEMSFKGLKS